MKYIVALISMFYNITSFAQTPNPDLFQTWYLYDYYSSDDNIHHPISTINPPVSPFVTFSTPSNLNGTGACNSFTGTFSTPFSGFLQFSNFNGTLSICSSSQQIDLENSYFGLFQNGSQYYITGTGTSMNLLISTPIFNNYVFGNVPLSTPNFELKQTNIYPNPAEATLYIDSQNKEIDKIEFLNTLGQTVKTVNSNFESIVISDLAAGVYILKFFAERTSTCKKIIKK